MTRVCLPGWAHSTWLALPPLAAQVTRRDDLWVLHSIAGAFYGSRARCRPGLDWSRQKMATLSRHRQQCIRRLERQGLLGARDIKVDGEKTLDVWMPPVEPEELVLRVLPDRHRRSDTSDRSNALCDHVWRNLDALDFPTGWHPSDEGLSLWEQCSLQRCTRQGLLGRYNVRRSKVARRINHVLTVGGSRPVRHVVQSDGVTLADIDIRAAHPFFLAGLGLKSKDRAVAKDAADLADQIANRDWDLYRLDPSISRDQAKADMMTLQAGTWIARRLFHQVFRERWPDLTASVIRAGQAGRNLNLKLQQLESRIMIDGVLAEARRRGLRTIPIHDGTLCRPKDAEEVLDLVVATCREVTGRAPLVTSSAPPR